MASRVPPRTRQAIIEFPDEPRRGEVSRFCRAKGISRAVFYQIRAKAAQQGPEAAILPRSTAPVVQARQTSKAVADEALRVRAELAGKGWDAGPLSVAAELRRRGWASPSRATLARVFTRAGVVIPEPDKRPRSSYRRFEYSQPNACWQLDGVEFKLDTGITRCILQVEDDNSRKILAWLVARAETSAAALAVVRDAVAHYGAPTRFLTDNSTAFNQSRTGGESKLERYLKSLGTTPISGRQSKPTTQGKNERLHGTLLKFLEANRPINSVERLRRLVAEFVDYYNHIRPNQALSAKPGQVPDTTPAQRYQAKPKALPAPAPITADTPVRRATIRKYPTRFTPKGTTPVEGTPNTYQADRRVNVNGMINICNTRIRVGTPLTGQILHTIFDETTITVTDPDGVILGVVPRATTSHDETVHSITPRKPGRPKKPAQRQQTDETQLSIK